MSAEIVVGVLSFVGTLVGTIGGILASNRVTTYRISQLETKVTKHNDLIDRMYKVENRVTLLEDEMKGR